jgi:hypothetical protein
MCGAALRMTFAFLSARVAQIRVMTLSLEREVFALGFVFAILSSACYRSLKSSSVLRTWLFLLFRMGNYGQVITGQLAG